MIGRLLAFVLFVLAMAGPASALDAIAVGRSGLSRAQAEEMLHLVLRHERLVTPGDHTAIEALAGKSGAELYPGYFAFGVSADSPESLASTTKGLFAVSAMTGDVWELNLCKRYTFSGLRKVQDQIMARTGKRFDDERAERRALGCSND